MYSQFYEFSVCIFQLLGVNVGYINEGHFLYKALKCSNDGFVKIPKLLKPCFITPPTYFKSLMFRHAFNVLYDHIKKETVDDLRHCFLGNIVWYYVKLVCNAWNSLTRKLFGIYLDGTFPVNVFRYHNLLSICIV